MKNIPKINIPKNIETNRIISSHLIFPKKIRKSNKTPDLSPINRYVKDKANSQSLINSTISFDQISARINKLFKNKEEFNNYMLDKRFLFSKKQYNKIIALLSEIDVKIKENDESIENMHNFLVKLKKTKKKKQSDIINLLSNKESLEEIYKSKIYHLKNVSQLSNIKNNSNNNDNNSYRNSTIKLFENDFIVSLKEIQLSDKQKFEEQVIAFAEEILKKKEEKLRNIIKEKINLAYSVFVNESNSTSNIDSDKIISNFFTRISLFISNQSLGNYSEQFINSFLRHIIKINFIATEISKILKFLNKKYKETKLEIREKINNLNKKNENLKNKKLIYEEKKEQLKNFIEENREIIKNNKKNKISLEEENIQYTSFFSDSNNISKYKIFSVKSNEDLTSEENDKVRNKGNNTKLKSLDKTKITNLNKSNISKEIYLNKKENNKSIDVDNLKNPVKTKNLNMKNILKVNNYQINTWNNKEGVIINTLDNIENINMSNNQIIDKYNNYIINYIPINKGINIQTYTNNVEQKENKFYINHKKNENENRSEININNLLINNNNINIQNNNIINNNNILKRENIKSKGINFVYSRKKNNSKTNFNDNTKLTKQKKINIPNSNNYKMNNNKRSINTDNLGNLSNDLYLNGFEKYGTNNSITEIKYNNNKKINNTKINDENLNKNNYNFYDILSSNDKKQNTKNIIMLNNSKCISQKNINKVINKNINIINSPIIKSRFITKKNQKSVISLNNTNKMNISKNSKSSDDQIENNSIYFTKISRKKSDLGKNSMRKIFFSNKNFYSNYNHNSYAIKKDSSMDKKIDISIIEKHDRRYTKRYDNRLKVLTQGIKKSFCYFKISNNDNIKFDPLDNCSSSPENFGYFDGYISIDIDQHKFKIIPNNKEDYCTLENLVNKDLNCSNNSNNDEEQYYKNYIGIDLKDITDIIISRQMKNIIRIYNTYLKYSNAQENVKINRFIYSREIMDIPMEHDQRIKAAFCNFFIFSVIFGKKLAHKIEFIFINYEQFNLWFDCLKYITKINNQEEPKIISKNYSSIIQK